MGSRPTLNVNHVSMGGISSGSNANLIDSLKAVTEKQNEIFAKMDQGLAGLHVTTQALANSIGEDSKSRTREYYQRRAEGVLGKYEVVSQKWNMGNLTESQKQVSSFANQIKKAADETGKFNTDSVQFRKAVNSMTPLMRQAGQSAQSMSGMAKIAEVLAGASAINMGRYLNIGAAYGVNVLGTPANQMGGLQVAAQTSQRSVMANMFTEAATGIGGIIGSIIPGIGTFIGSGIGMAIGSAVSLPGQLAATTLNAQQRQKLTIQQLAAGVALGTGQFGQMSQINQSGFLGSSVTAGANSLSALHGNFFTHMLQHVLGTKHYSAANSQIAALVNSGLGYVASTAAAAQISGTAFFNRPNAATTADATTLALLAAASGQDLSGAASSIGYLEMRNRGKVGGLIGGLYSQTGIPVSQIMGTMTSLAQMTPQSMGQISAQFANTARFGQSYQQAAMGLQFSPMQSKFVANMVLAAFAPGATVEGLAHGDASSIYALRRGEFAGRTGVKDFDPAEFLIQQVIPASSDYAFANAQTGKKSISGVTSLTDQQIEKILPDAVKKAMSNAATSAVQNAVINISHATISYNSNSSSGRSVSQTAHKLSG